MKAVFKLACGLGLSALLLTGCDQLSGGSSIAVLDLAAVAKATGQDEEIRKQAEAARADLTAQLQQLAVNMDQQLIAEREKIGSKPSEEDNKRLQEMTQQARQQINNAQVQAQNEAGKLESELVQKFRDKVDPLAEKIAREKGAKALLAEDSYLFWHEPEIDITDEVIEAWRALPPEDKAAVAADQPAASAAGSEQAAPTAATDVALPAVEDPAPATPEQTKAAD